MSPSWKILTCALTLLVSLACGGEQTGDSEPPPAAGATQDADASPGPAAARGEGLPTRRFDFDSEAAGAVPAGFAAVHSGRGAAGRWQVVDAPDAPSGGRAAAQLDGDRTSSRFPLLVLEAVSARDLELSVAGKPISGRKDQAVGLIWRYRDPDNYYVVRSNALEDNVVLYKMEGGKRSDLDVVDTRRSYGVDVEVPGGSWSTLGVRVQGNLFTVFFAGRELFQVEDDTFPGAGRVGLWTKADSVTWFDDFEVTVLDAEDPAAAAAGEAQGGSP